MNTRLEEDDTCPLPEIRRSINDYPNRMPLEVRLAVAPDYQKIENMGFEILEPITWFKKLDDRIGPLNGRDWRMRWKDRLRHVFETQIVLVGKSSGETAAMSSGTLNHDDALAYIDLLAVDRRFRHRG